MADWELDRFRSQHITFVHEQSRRLDDLKSHVQALGRLFRRIAYRARDLYEWVQMFGEPDLTVLAECRIGEIYDKWADLLNQLAVRFPVPDEVRMQGAAAARNLRQSLIAVAHKFAAKLRRTAMAAYRHCLQSATGPDLSQHAIVQNARVRHQALLDRQEEAPPASQPIVPP